MKPQIGGAPEYRSRCAYCGEPEPDAHRSCCGERHFSDESPECPNCGNDVDIVKHDVTGIETFTYQCQSCDWCSDPE